MEAQHGGEDEARTQSEGKLTQTRLGSLIEALVNVVIGLRGCVGDADNYFSLLRDRGIGGHECSHRRLVHGGIDH